MIPKIMERLTGGIKKNPRCAGKRKTGLDVKRRDREFASPNAEAVRGPVSVKVRNVDGVARARMG